jgi:ABC-2 type transport system permease protein
MFMMLGAGGTTELILKEKRSRTYFRICASPVKSRNYLAGIVVTSLLIAIVQVIVVLIMIKHAFRLDTFVPMHQLFAILICFSLVAVGLGLLMVSFSKDSVQAGMLQTLIITPTCLLSGCFWPIDIMPQTVQKVSDFLPQKWALLAIQRLQTGINFSDVLPYIAVVLAFAFAFFLVAVYRFSRNESVTNFV